MAVEIFTPPYHTWASWQAEYRPQIRVAVNRTDEAIPVTRNVVPEIRTMSSSESSVVSSQ